MTESPFIDCWPRIGESLPFPISRIQFAADDGAADQAFPGYQSLFVDLEREDLKRGKDIVAVYDALRPSLLAYLVGLGLVREEAEDIIQESFIRLMRHLGENQGDQHLRPWLFRVAHNLAIDQFRSGQYHAAKASIDVSSLEGDLCDARMSPEELLLQREQWILLQQAVARLTPQQQYAVLLRAEGMRYREIAEILGVSTKRVGELVQRALIRLAGGQ
jgi:RNA polymerase sigma-70 factor, ECF subfamily